MDDATTRQLLDEATREWLAKVRDTEARFIERYGDVPRVSRTWLDPDGCTLRYELTPVYPS